MSDSSCDEADTLKSCAGVAFQRCSMSLSLSSCHTNISTSCEGHMVHAQCAHGSFAGRASPTAPAGSHV